MYANYENFPTYGRSQLFLVADTETATLPFADEIATNAKQKQKIAIAKPLIYDFAWIIVDRSGREYARRSFLVSEIFSVPSIFNTAYYKEKRPIYLDRLAKGLTEVKTWAEVSAAFIADLEQIDYVCAYNAMFDYKKAIAFTDLYISKLYSANYAAWESMQKEHAFHILTSSRKQSEKEFDPENFRFRNVNYPMIDIWGVACESLINNKCYKEFCLKTGKVTESGKYFDTSAEAVFQYATRNHDFTEAHTAIDDSEIEAELLVKAMRRGKITYGIQYFPFKILGMTTDFLRHGKHIKPEYYDAVISAMQAKLATYQTENRFFHDLDSTISILEGEKELRFA